MTGTEAPPRASIWRRSDVTLAFTVGVLAIAVTYYALLLQVTTWHRTVQATTERPLYAGVLLVLVLVTCLLFGANFAVLNLLVRAHAGATSSVGSFLGATVGAFAAGCPSCGAFLLSLVGVSAGLAALPFAGLELWTAASATMALALWSSLRRLRGCSGSDRCASLPAPSMVHLGVLLAMLVTVAGAIAAVATGFA